MLLRIAIVSSLLTASASAQSDFKVKILEVKGSAETRPGVDKAWSELKEGMTVSNGAWVQTGLKSRVYLKFGDNTVVQVKSATLLQITDAAKEGNKLTAKLKLALGNVHVEVQKSSETVDFKVVTPDVTTSVKGTGYSAKHYSDMGSKINVDHGLVRVDNRFTSQDVPGGKKTTSDLLPADMKAQLENYIATAFDSLMTGIEFVSPDAQIMTTTTTKDVQTTNNSETLVTSDTTTTTTGGGTTNGGGTTTGEAPPPIPLPNLETAP